MIRFAAASVAVALACLSAGAAGAQDYRIAFGDLDLESAHGAARFDQRVNQTARAACTTGALLADAQCVRRFRVEAFLQLPRVRRDDYARARNTRLVARTPVDQS